ncbi:hypothetical protein M0E78_03180 [Corynebacterium sp. P6145]|nr:hypothetical protein [Corynebacterium antarcticum]MCK7641927.1 hypothetical protein [Corynebacterium antarcticum]
MERVCPGVGEQVVPEGVGEHGQALVDGREFPLGFRGEIGAAAGEPAQQVTVEPRALRVAVRCGDRPESRVQGGVGVQRVAVRGELRDDLPGDRLPTLRRVGAEHVEQPGSAAGQLPSGGLQRLDGVLPGGFLHVVSDLTDLIAVSAQGLREGFPEHVIVDVGKPGQTVFEGRRIEERMAAGVGVHGEQS